MTVQLSPRLAVAIALDGAPLERAVAVEMSAMLVRQALAAPGAAELDFVASPPVMAALSTGRELRVEVGGQVLFEGRIEALEQDFDLSGGRTVRVRAYDALQQLRMRRRMRAWPNTSAAALARDMAGEIGCVFETSASTPDRTLVIQAGESDAELLVALAAESGSYPIVSGRTLSLVGLDGVGDPVSLVLGRDLRAVRIRTGRERALASSAGFAWSPASAEVFRAKTASARQDRRSDGVPEIREGAADLLRARLAESEGEVAEAAQAQMDRAAAFEVSASGTADGDPAIRPGRPVEIGGLGGEGARRFVVSEATHRFDARGGYVTEFSSEPPAVALPARRTLFSLGRVHDTDDPKRLGRCRVKLPTLSDVESGWMAVVVAGAGPAKGVAVLPETGDDVLVVFPEGDPSRGIVLGGLWGERRLPRGANRKSARPFVLRTGGGQTLELGADNAYARLSTSAGSLVELAGNRMRVAAASDLLIEAPGRTITIRAAFVNFERG